MLTNKFKFPLNFNKWKKNCVSVIIFYRQFVLFRGDPK